MRKINTSLPLFIDYDSVSFLMQEIDKSNEDILVTWNGFGGSTGASQVLAGYLSERKSKSTADVAGMAASANAFLLPFFDYVKGANQADIMIHSVSGGIESTHEHTNNFLYKALLKKVDEIKFKEITGYDLKEVMFPK